MRASQALKLFLKETIPGQNVLNIGDTENSEHDKLMREAGLNTTVIGLSKGAGIMEDYIKKPLGGYDHIWSSHCLEHQRNPGLFLDKLFCELKERGVLCITVPPAKEGLTGGHVTIWNEAVLLYQLVMAGFNCSQAIVQKYGYNISVLVRKKSMPVINWQMNKHDLPILKKYIPEGI